MSRIVCVNGVAGCIHAPVATVPCGYDLELALASVGPGWHPLVRRVFAAKPADVRIVQVKEKFGELRVYIDRFHEAFMDVIDAACIEAQRTCEACGAPGEVGDPLERWLKAACAAHRARRTETGRWDI